MSIQKIKKTTLPEQVYEIIKENIKNGFWAEGTKLPSENELAISFGVNRMTIRSALQKLGVIGIVETKVGEGTFVKKFDLTEYVSSVSDLLLSPEMLDEVMEFRKCIELECIKLATQRADDKDFAELEKALQVYECAVKDKTKTSKEHIHAIIEADLDFHYQICMISKNSVFALSFATVRVLLYQYIHSVLLKRYNRFVADSEQDRFAIAATQNHREILEAIKSRDYEACEQTYIRVIDYKNVK